MRRFLYLNYRRSLESRERAFRERFSAPSGREILSSCVFRHGQCYPDFPDNLITVTRAYAVELYGSFAFSCERVTRAAVEQGTSITSGVRYGGGCIPGEYHLALNSRLYDSSRATPIAPKREMFLASINGNIFSTQIRKAALPRYNKFASIFLRIGRRRTLARQVAEAKISPISHPSRDPSIELPFFHRGTFHRGRE